MLKPFESDIDLRERSPLALAFVGDGVLELLVRSHLVAVSRSSVSNLHRQAIQMVSAKAQHQVLSQLLPLLSEQETGVFRRGRNANKASAPKHASAQEYSSSTGLECLFGWLYLRNDMARIEELFAIIWQNYLQQHTGEGDTLAKSE